MPDQRSRNWCFTINNWTDEDIQWFNDLECKFIVIGKEVGACGTKHLQGYVNFQHEKGLKVVKRLHKHAHWEIRRGTDEQAYDYCIKDGDYGERGVRQMSQAAKGEAGKLSAAERTDLAKQGKFDDLPPENRRAYREIYREEMAKSVTDLDAFDNHWLKGRSGVGKSRAVRETFAEFYSKNISKWWDGYNYEKIVLLDDVDDSTADWLPRYLKIWADRYTFNGEMKGAMFKMRPLAVVVTSQLGIGACCKTAEEIEAVERRFKLWEWDPNANDFFCVEEDLYWKPYWKLRVDAMEEAAERERMLFEEELSQALSNEE